MQGIKSFVIFLDFHSQLYRGSHWLILGHVALTKVKCIPIVPDTKTQKPNGKKLGTYSPTDAVAQPLGVERKKSINR